MTGATSQASKTKCRQSSVKQPLKTSSPHCLTQTATSTLTSSSCTTASTLVKTPTTKQLLKTKSTPHGVLFYFALCLFVALLYKHSLVRRRNARSSGDEEGSAEHQTLYAGAGALCFFCTKAISGIMRRCRLMCESRVCPCPQGSAEWQMGETREEGGHILDMFALSMQV